ncbi:hypothetical protein EHS25_000889 [Saitozyma podzolica]|uniref:Major facilitator superfamily (MFS) profile domain-containing protein n=1 Tax=Saitozyma podzolica TaxID=1890683 RepID=A0A427YXI2_9TREE|nr:hypothetical protein EHS25_000889 [Saitozyma podzolica]
MSAPVTDQVSEHIHTKVPEQHLEHDITGKQEEGEHPNHGHRKDAALELLGQDRVEMTDEQASLPIRHGCMAETDVMSRILDKSCVGYGANFGLQTEAHLVGDQYSLISSSGYWAQLAFCCGFTAFLIVRVPTRLLMSTCILCWGTTMIGLAFSKSFGPLLANRFLLGMFEAINIPLFTVVTMTWYRRREQPIRIAVWYGTNGVASMLGSLLAYGLSFIVSPVLYVYQILFLTVGLATVITAPLIYWRLDNNPATAKFLTPQERLWAVERLRNNNTGVETKEIKWKQVLECLLSPAVWLFFVITFCVNVGAAVTNTFGPLIIKGFGFDARQTILLNIPFGFVQAAVCVLGCILAARFGYKGLVIISFMLPCVLGSGLLYGLGRTANFQGGLLFGYYCIGFLFGCNPLIFSWIAANTGGHTKKSLAISLCNAGSAVGNIVGPLLFNSNQAPEYHPGVAAVLGIFISCSVLSGVLTFVFALMNKHKEKQRVAHGKPAKIIDTSMHKVYQAAPDDEVAGGYRLGDQAFLDLTDVQNDEVGASLFLLLTMLMKRSSLSIRTERLTIWNEFMRTTHRLIGLNNPRDLLFAIAHDEGRKSGGGQQEGRYPRSRHKGGGNRTWTQNRIDGPKAEAIHKERRE